MVGIVRPDGRSSLLAGLLVTLVAGFGCGKGKSGTSQSTGALRIISTPVHAAQVGSQASYQAVLSQPGSAEWTMQQGPHGATVDQGGTVTWTPDATQGGDQAFAMSAKLNGHTVTQTFQITAASTVVETSAHVDPADPNGATVTVDAPLSPVQGAAVQIDPGALPPGAPVAVTISSMQHAPVPPAAAIAGLKPEDLKPVELGPSGLTFETPARVQLPISARLLTMPALTVQTYDYGLGQWRRVKVLSIDKTAGVAIAEIEHFSTYVVTPDLPVFDLKLALGGSACAGALVVRAPLVVGFANIKAGTVNGYAGTADTVADLLAAMKPGEALQLYTRVTGRARAATGQQTGWLLAAAAKQDDGTFKVSVTSDSHAGGFLTVPAAGLAAGDPELASWMTGGRADFVFGALGNLSGGAVASAEASLYLVPASDATRPPPTSANTFGTGDVEATSLTPLEGAVDDDCDGAPNAWDPTPAGATPPALVGVPGNPVHVAVGDAAPFKVTSPQPDVAFTWAASEPSVTVISAMAGMVATATASLPGLYHLTATGTVGTGAAAVSSTYVWDVIAVPASVAAGNTPPVVAVSASANLVRAGETVTLKAFGKDAQQTALTYLWAATDATALSATTGETVTFTANAPGDYVVTCLANDGSASSPPAMVTLTVLSPTANRPPGAPSVSPLTAALTHDPGAPVSLTLTAKAVDPDGDVLTYDFAPDPATPPTFTLTKSGASAAFSSSQDGVYVFYVTATDPNGARGPWAPVKVLVLPTLGTAPVDADKDGFPVGFDCNDGDPTVHPGAKELCGDGKDQDCDGQDLAVAQCDADGDRFTPAQGDCDDKNPAIGPKMPERCDLIDNNCNGVTDEGFGVGVDCANGVGACQVASKTVCSASFVDVVCGGKVGAPMPEVCDGVDNDCNGRIDDVSDLAATGGGDAQNCGGCGIACATATNSLAVCVQGGCVSTCTAGFVDADRSATNGCECKLSNNGVEICDGLDNDCNGAVDDGVGAVNYAGPAGTQGVGVCAAGLEICRGGQLVQALPPRLPTTELCDGLDNDCNGKVDDGWDFLNDAKNCGGCGRVCAAGTTCVLGRCPTVVATDGGVAPDGGVPGSSLTLCGVATPACVDTVQDRANCGKCGAACAATEFCQNSACVSLPAINCLAPQAACLDPSGGKLFCADLQNDGRNCGACGTVCAGNTFCQRGACATATSGTVDAGAAMSCNGGFGMCLGAQSSTYCADPMHGFADCGACGRTCAQGQYCNDGACVVAGAGTACTGTQSGCPTAAGSPYCVELSKDYANCGACGRMCPSGTQCTAGVCLAPSCTSPTSTCLAAGGGVYCADLAHDAANCGKCGTACATNAICTGGVCQGGGGTYVGLAACGAAGALYCTNLLNDQGNCGECGHMCATGESCYSGFCATTPPLLVCGSGNIVCMDAALKPFCVNPLFDGGNCGKCGVACAATESCSNGTCAVVSTSADAASSCRPPFQACTNATGTQCVDLTNDTANCGTCGHDCGGGMFCSNSACLAAPDGGATQTIACAVNYQACYPAAGPAYCTSFATDPVNCGACFNACGGGYACQGGKCGPAPDGGAPQDAASLSCKASDTPCDGTYCANLMGDPGNCGGCHITCTGAQVCNAGKCM